MTGARRIIEGKWKLVLAPLLYLLVFGKLPLVGTVAVELGSSKNGKAYLAASRVTFLGGSEPWEA
jgi:hypothetical protein